MVMGNDTLLLQQHFDHTAKLSSYDATILPGTEYANRFGINYVNIVHDYNTGTHIQHAVVGPLFRKLNLLFRQ